MSMPDRVYAVCHVSNSPRAQKRTRTGTRWLRAVAALLVLPLADSVSALALPTPTLDRVQQKLAGLAVPFEANQGQFAPEVAFAARTFAGTLFVTKDGRIVHALAGKPEQKKDAEQRADAQKSNEVIAADYKLDDRTSKLSARRGPGWALVESLQGAGELKPAGSQSSSTSVSRFAGGAKPNQTSNIATFDRVLLGEAWPGVSVELAARGSNVEKLFTVAPGTNPNKIRMGVAGAKRLRLGDDGSLIATTGNGDIDFTPPVAFQNIGGKRYTVPISYVLLAGNGYRFEVSGVYDHSQPLVIDPLLQATYLGGSGYDQATALAVDAGGNIFVAGGTSSSNFPGTIGGAQPSFSGGTDVFVARLSNNLTMLSQVTYLGGSNVDQAQATALAIGSGGNVFVSGATNSTKFPGIFGGAQPTNGGSVDTFVARLSNSLTTLEQATYLGGSGYDQAAALALDASGNVFVAGQTDSTNFPDTSGGAQSTIGGGSVDAFVARLSSNLTTLVKATYLGGSGSDQAFSLALDAGGNVLVAGTTNSTNFPGTTGGAQAANGGSDDAFVARISNNLTTLVQATYLGAGNSDVALALAVDAGGRVFVAGSTASTNFPGTTGGAQPAIMGTDDAFVACLSSDLATLTQATYLGGSGTDQASALAVGVGGNVLVAGSTDSTNFPGTTGGAQPTIGGGSSDAFVARLSSNLATLVNATYLGGSSIDRAYAMVLDAGGNVLVAGFTGSIPGTAGGAQPVNGGGGDAFVAKLTPDLYGDKIFANGFE